MRKYKNQTLISVVGLAVGFTCFALATLWIRYERTFDQFHKRADLIYVLTALDSHALSGVSRSQPYPLAAYMKETFPEVRNAATVAQRVNTVQSGEMSMEVIALEVDSTFLNMFDVKILEGNLNFSTPDSKDIAITLAKSKKIFGDENPIGKEILGGTITAIVSGWNNHSNYFYDLLLPITPNPAWNYRRGENTIIELFPNANEKAFFAKLSSHTVSQLSGNEGERPHEITGIEAVPITKMRCQDSIIDKDIKYQYILLFSFAGLLVIFCSLFNYFTLFFSRFRMREKEFALRMVCGASTRSLFFLLSVEFFLIMFIASLLGLFLTHLSFPVFCRLSNIQMDLSAVILEVSAYIFAIILFTLLLFFLILVVFRKRNLNTSIKEKKKSGSRKVLLVMQLMISLIFAFCTIIMMKQLNFLHQSDNLGIDFKNTATLVLPIQDEAVLYNHFQQISEISSVMLNNSSLIPQLTLTTWSVSDWEGKAIDDKEIFVEDFFITDAFIDFYDVQLIAGEGLSESDDESWVLINEATVKAFKWDNPIGKTFINYYKVKGVIKDIYKNVPTVPVKPIIYSRKKESNQSDSNLSFRYQEGTWDITKEKIDKLMQEEYPQIFYPQIFNAENIYNTYFQSEAALLKLLSFVSLVCIIISVFGFFSLVSLSCEERRKEIAIRKINGAGIKDILSIFFNEYFTLLVVGAVVTFPIAYYLIKKWMEQYVLQTNIPVWIYIVLVLVLAFVIVLCVGWQVYKTSKENPSEVLKGE